MQRGHGPCRFFGKFLLVLNLLGAAALGWFAIQDYGKRQAWSYSVLAYDFILDGLPLDDAELDKQGFALAARIADPGSSGADSQTPLLKHLFSGNVGEPVLTQADEVKRVQAETMAKIQPLEGKARDHAYALAGVLLPFAEYNLDREQYIAARMHLVNDLALGALRKRYGEALLEGKALLAAKEGRKPDEAFRLAFRRTPGLPAEAVTSLIAAKLPAKDLEGVNIDKLFADALESQRQAFKARLDGLFADTEKSPEMPNADKKASLDTRKQSIARLLIGLALGKDGDESVKARRRAYVVTGIKFGIGAISERAAILRQLAGLADSSAATERGAFVADLTYLVEAARDEADRLKDEDAAVADSAKKLADQLEILKKTAAIIEAVTKDRDEAVVKTAEQMEKLKELSSQLLKDRVEARDLIAALLDRERQVRELDKQVRELQLKSK